VCRRRCIHDLAPIDQCCLEGDFLGHLPSSVWPISLCSHLPSSPMTAFPSMSIPQTANR
jgi:hypothetical protein